MFDFELFLKRLYAAVAGIMFATWCLSMATTAHAATFNRCTPNSSAWQFVSDPDSRAQAQQRETLRCETENAVLDDWAAKITALENARDTISNAANRADWEAFTAALADVKTPLLEMQQAASDHPNAPGSAALRSLFGQDLNYFFQNAGLSAPSSFDDALAKIEQAATTPGQNSQAATLASSLLNQAVSRGNEFARSLSRAAGDQVRAETKSQREKLGQERLDRLKGRTVDGYFSGFLERLLMVWKPWLVMLMVVTFLAAWIGMKRKVNPVLAAVAAGGAYLVPGTVMAGSFVAFPFLPFWFVVPATLAGTLAVFLYAGQVFDWLADRAGSTSGTARRLRLIGGVIDNLRAGLGGTPRADAVSSMAADKATHGSARWGTTDELKDAGHLDSRAAPPKQAGLALARVSDAPENLDQRFRYVGHVVTVAPNGSGKGIGAVIPNLLEYPGSCLVLDVKGENAAVTARARRELGHKVYQVDPFGVNGSEGAGFNVLDRLDVQEADCVSESAMLADSLVISDAKGKADHFDESAKTLLQGMMLHVVAGDDPDRRNLGELRRLLTADEDTFLATLAEMAADESAAFGVPARAANTVMGMADRERGSVLSTARRNTAFLDDPRVASALSRSDFDLSAIKSDLMTVYLVMPANKIATNARFVRLFVGSVIAAITASSQQPPHRVAFILDEFAQLGYMKQIEDAVSLMRGYGLAFWVFLQDLSQLKGVYPRWQTFLANSAKTFFGTDDYDTAKYVSDSLGQATIEYETENTGSNSGSGFSSGGGSMNRGKSSGSSQQYAGRPLLTPDEVMRLGPERPVVLVKGEYPYQLDRLNYLSDAEYIGKADPNPYHS